MVKKPNEIAVMLREAGRKKTLLTLDRMFILAVLAGVYVGFGAQLATTVSMDLAPYVGIGLSNMISGAVFSVGLMLVVLGGAELFTGNNLIWLSYLGRRSKLSEVMRNWVTVYLGNFIGSVLLVFIIFVGGFYTLGGDLLGVRALAIANSKVNLGFVQLVARGIVCNWLVCMAVWLATSTEDATGKILACLFPIMAFVASGYEHSIANMYFIPMGILLKGVPSLALRPGLELTNLTWGGLVFRNLIPVTLGNIIGGCFFVATLYWYIYLRVESRALDMIMELNTEAEEDRGSGLEMPQARELSD
jgi:formate/nitrite transporter